MSIEHESGSSVLIDMHGMPGMGSMGRPPATVADEGKGEHENPGSNPIGDPDMLLLNKMRWKLIAVLT